MEPKLRSFHLSSSRLYISLLLRGLRITLAWRGGKQNRHDTIVSDQMPTSVVPIECSGEAPLHGCGELELGIEYLYLRPLKKIFAVCVFSLCPLSTFSF